MFERVKKVAFDTAKSAMQEAIENLMAVPLYVPASDEREFYYASLKVSEALKLYCRGLAKLHKYQGDDREDEWHKRHLTRRNALLLLESACLYTHKTLDSQLEHLKQNDRILWDTINDSRLNEPPNGSAIPPAHSTSDFAPPSETQDTPWPGDVYHKEGSSVHFRFICLLPENGWRMAMAGSSSSREIDFTEEERKGLAPVSKAARPIQMNNLEAVKFARDQFLGKQSSR